MSDQVSWLRRRIGLVFFTEGGFLNSGFRCLTIRLRTTITTLDPKFPFQCYQTCLF